MNTNDNVDYYKIPIENLDLSKHENEHPKKQKVVSKHTIIIDSRQRNYNLYPTPSNYQVELMEPHRNVERIELIAAMMPKTNYNVSTENNLLLVSVNGNPYVPINLTPGQYLIGSNVYGSPNYSSNGSVVLTGLLAELQTQLNTYSGSANFNVFLATVPSPTGTGNNASVLNRVVITNSADSFSIDFRNTGYTSESPFRLLGFQKMVYTSLTSGNIIYATPGSENTGICTSADLVNGNFGPITINNVIADYDYNLQDDPKYIIMQLEFGNRSAERVESIDLATNQKFAVIIYDANEPDNIQTYNSSKLSTDNVVLQVDRKPGRLKALKGSDFDKKILDFTPPITLENFKISFTKYDDSPYDFNNREHMLSFELDVADYDPMYRY
uniref:DUF5901 domain-containing protein n=1 Tax=viral metagenome TaxID=1070528 RepID=A0A6C0I7T8_9ZZZZ